MTKQQQGASSGEDRAVVNGAGQAVSAVPASVPSAVDELVRLASSGHWSAGAFHNPPRRGQPSNSILGAQWFSLRGQFATREEAMEVAENAVRLGRIDGTFLHTPTARASATYSLPPRTIDAIGELAQAIEARRAETTGSACESAVGEADAPESDLTNIYNHAAEVFAPLPDQFHRGGEEPNKTSPENK